MRHLNLLFNSSIFYLILFIQQLNTQDYNVLDFGAKGDGKTYDTQAIRSALAAAAKTNGGRVIFDAGLTFLTAPLNITSNIILDVRGTILASINASDYVIIPENIWDGNRLIKQPIIFPYNATNFTITGGGIIDGQGPYWYACMNNNSLPPCYPYGSPRLVMPKYTSNILVENITLKDSPYWTLHLAWTTNVYINNITVLTPLGPIYKTNHTGLQTDGVDIDCSVNVTVENSYISTGDDAVSVKSGVNWNGRTYGRTSENIMVRNLTVGYLNGLSEITDLNEVRVETVGRRPNGLAIGSGASAGARNVTFKDIILNGSERAICIKTQIGRGGTVEDVTFSNIKTYNALYAIEINMYYTKPGSDTALPIIKNIIIDNVTGENTTYVYNILGLPQSPPTNVYFSNIEIKNFNEIYHDCHDIIGICDNSTVVPHCPPCLTTESCFDASSDCATYANYCNLQQYRAMMCDQCRKSCKLCQSC